MLNGDLLYRRSDSRDSAFVRAVANERGMASEDAVSFLNAWMGHVRERTAGSGCSSQAMRELLDGLHRYGFFPSAIQSMCRRFPNLLCCGWPHAHGTRTAPGLLLRLEAYGFSRPQLLRICFRLPAILSYSWNRTHGTGDAPGLLLRLEEYGFSKQQIILMCAPLPALLSYAWGRTHGTKDKPGILLRLEEYGFTRDQAIAICRRFSTVLAYSWERTHGTADSPGILLRLEAHGLSRSEVIALCMQCPILLGCRWERTAEQLQLAEQFDLVLRPQLFLFAPGKTQWRWHFLTSTRALSEKQTRAALFLNNKEFLQRFGEDYAGRPEARSRS